jgi:hypothetical protein
MYIIVNILHNIIDILFMATSKRPIQLNLFQSSQKLNLSETYEGILKDISKNEPRIKWINDNIAESVESPFNIRGNSYISEIWLRCK